MEWRNQYAVLVPQADAAGMVGVIRSLGRAGYRVFACAADADAIGLWSRYADHAVVHPPYGSSAFIAWLDEYLASNAIDAIVPSEGFLVAVQAHYERYGPLFPDAPDAATVYRCMSKAAVFDALLAAPSDSGAGDCLPPSFVASRDNLSDLQRWLDEHPAPYFVKLDACLDTEGGDGGVLRKTSGADVLTAADALLPRYGRFLVQGSVDGCKATVNLYLSGGRVRADTMCVAMHENPHTGGLTSYRRTWWNDAMRADAERKLRYLEWQGVAMVEYKWDEREQTFHFIELNARYWAALHLDLFAGSDIPRLQLDRHFGAPEESFPRQRLGLRARYTVPADFGYALSRARDRQVSFPGRIGAVVGFILLSFDPFVRTDLFFPGDRGLYWRQWRWFFGELLAAVRRRFGGG